MFKLRLYAAGLVAALVGFPLTAPAVADVGEVIEITDASISLARAIAETSGGS